MPLTTVMQFGIYVLGKKVKRRICMDFRTPPPQTVSQWRPFCGYFSQLQLSRQFVCVKPSLKPLPNSSLRGLSIFWRPTHLRSRMLLRKEPLHPPSTRLTKRLNCTAHEIWILQIKYKPLQIIWTLFYVTEVVEKTHRYADFIRRFVETTVHKTASLNNIKTPCLYLKK